MTPIKLSDHQVQCDCLQCGVLRAELSEQITFRRVIELFISLHVLVSDSAEGDSLSLVGVHSQRRTSTAAAAGIAATCIKSKLHVSAITGLTARVHVCVQISHCGCGDRDSASDAHAKPLC